MAVTNLRAGLLAAVVLACLGLPAPAAEFDLDSVDGTIASDEADGFAAIPPVPSPDDQDGSLLDMPSLASECYECPADGSRCDNCPPAPYGVVNRLIDNKDACWTLRVDALLLWRNAPRSRPLFETSTGNRTALDAHQLNSAPAAGPRFSLFRTDGCGDALEATYFRAANFRAYTSLPPVTDGYVPTFGPAPAAYETASGNLGSSLQSFELNGRMTVLPILQLLGGFRWFEWNESMQLVGSSSTFVPPIRDVVNTSCINSLYGYQIGFDSLVLSTNWLRLEGLMKGGAYFNNAVQTTTANTGFGPYSNRVNTPHAASFLGEVGLTGVVPITRNLDLRVGYLGLWLEGIAQPTLQPLALDPAVPTKLNTTGGVVVQGVTIGLDGRW